MVVGRGVGLTFFARFRGGSQEPFWRQDRLFRWKRLTQGVPQVFWVRDKIAI